VSGVLGVLTSPALANNYSDLPPDDLVCACADLRNSAAWDEFIRRFHTVIYKAASRTCRRYGQFDRDLFDDLVQDTYLRLSAKDAKALRAFVPRHPGSAYCYVQVIAVRVTQDYCKRKDILRTGELSADPPDSAAPNIEEWLALKAEIADRRLKHASARDRQIFWLYHLQGMTAKEIAAIPAIGLTVKGVESVLQRLRSDPGKF
jgi:RNA polymerase sigma factor (sigma-70 family)